MRSARRAFIAFVAVEVIALPVLLYLVRDRWFQHDEWDFLASRETNLHDLFAPHDVHWTTLPILLYRGMWQVFGIRSYVPYQVASVLAHLVVAALVRVAMRRAGVRPWTATAAATLLVFFGSGEENIGWAFQICFTGAIAFGLAHLLLADHDGPVNGRDWLGLLAGFAALLCSGAAVTMVFIVGLAMLLRRGWRVAALHTLPLGMTYAVWYAAIGHDGYRGHDLGNPMDVPRFVGSAIATTFGGLAQVPGLGWLLGAFLVAGLILAWHGRRLEELRRIAAVPLAMLVGAFVFLSITGLGRAETGFADLAHATRFIYIAGALSLPAIAVAADAFICRSRVAASVLVVALALSLAGNVRAFSDDRALSGDYLRHFRTAFLLMPRLPIGHDLPRSLHPLPFGAEWVTLGWLRDGVASGRIPDPGPVDAVARATIEIHLVLRRQSGHRAVACEQVVGPAHMRLAAGSSIRVNAADDVWIVYTDATGVQSSLVVYHLAPAVSLVAYVGRLDVQVHTTSGKSFEVCDRAGGVPAAAR